MAVKVWTFALDDGPHRVELDHNMTWGKLRVRVDGGEARPLGRPITRNPMDTEYSLTVGSRTVALCLSRIGLGHSYDLTLDGLSLETGQARAQPASMPIWGWGLLALCAPLVLGGGLGAGLGVSSALICYGVARDTSKSVGLRVGICLAVIVACWIVYLFLAAVLMAALHRR